MTRAEGQVVRTDARRLASARALAVLSILWHLEPGIVAAAMVGDRTRDGLVVGKTRARLQERFGSLVALGDASTYLQNCYGASHWRGMNVSFLPQSARMIVFDGNRAAELVLIKGQ